MRKAFDLLSEVSPITAVALLALAEPIEGAPTFHLGYAVMESRRGGRRVQRTAMAAIDEICHGFRPN